MKTYCHCGGANELLANFCHKCGKQLIGGQKTAVANRTAEPAEDDDEYEQFLKFKRSRKNTKRSYSEDDDDSDEPIPTIEKLSVAIQGNNNGKIPIESIINTSTETNISRRTPAITNVSSFMKDWASDMRTRKPIEID